MLLTLKLQCNPPDLNEGFIKSVIKETLPLISVERMKSLEDGIVLVTVSSSNQKVFDNLYRVFPIANEQLTLVQTWVHYPDTLPIVLLRNPPPGTNKDKLEAYLEGLEVYIENIFQSDDDDTITIELSDPIDLPFLVTRRHSMRRQPIAFLEASTLVNIQEEEKEEEEYLNSYSNQIVNQQAPTPIFYQNEQYKPHHSPPSRSMNDLDISQNGDRHFQPSLTNSALKIRVNDSLLSDSFLETTLKHRYLHEPYCLTVEHISVRGGTAYVTFLEGIEKAVTTPLTTILGCPVQCEVVPIESVNAFKGVPKVLLLKSLPDMSEERIKKRLEKLFKNVGHIVDKCLVKGNEAYVSFEDSESVQILVNNPPDSSTLAGHLIIYSTADNTDIFEEKNDPEDSSSHHMLIVENLPDEWDEDFEEDFVRFMNNNTSCKMVSHEVKNGKGYIHFENPEDAKKVAETPPSRTFYGKSIKFRIEPLNKDKLVHTESVPFEMSSMPPSKGMKEIGEGRNLGEPIHPRRNTSPAASPVIPPPIKPRNVSDIVIQGITPDITDYYLKLYLESLPLKVRCSEIQMNEGMAVVKLNNKIDIKTLQHNITKSPFPDPSVVLTVEPLRPSSAVHKYSTTDITADNNRYSSSFSDTIIIKELPISVKDWKLSMHLQNLGVMCKDIQRKEGNIVVVQMDKKIDIKSLQQKVLESPLPEGPLIIECPLFSPLSSPNNTASHSSGELSLLGRPHYTRTLIVKEIPLGVQPYVVKMYLNSLSGAKCTDIQMNEDTAIVVLDREIDIKDLRKKSLDEVFPHGDVVLHIDSHKPTTCILVTAEAPLPLHVLEMYCERYGEVEIERKTEKEFIVTFPDQETYQLCLDKKTHIAGAHKFTVSVYNPLFNRPSTFDITTTPSSEDPPPVPPRPMAYYTWPNCKVTISPESHKYYMHFQKDINNELHAIEGELHIGLTSLEVRPLVSASLIDDWEIQVRRKIETYKQSFESAELELPSQVAPVVLEFLADTHVKYPDLDYKPHGKHLTLAGHTKTVRKLTDEIQKMVAEEIEITYKLDKPPRLIQYILKFAHNEISSVQPRVDIDYREENPGSVTLRGVKRSLETVKKISETKINQSHTEIIPLTTCAYELLQSPKGKRKIKEVLDNLENSVFYMCEKTDMQLDYHYQLCILSPDSISCHSAKRRISSLIDEKRIQITPQEKEVCNSHEWKVFLDTITTNCFVRINIVKDETILLTGDEKNLRDISEQITVFLHSQNVITDTIYVSGPVWQLISDLKKLKGVQKSAKSRKVKITLPESRSAGDQSEVAINLSGDPRALEDVKAQLVMLISEVNSKVFNIRPQPGLEKVVEKGMIRMKCHELEHQHKLVINYAMEELAPPVIPTSTTTSTSQAPLRVLSGNGPNGIKVQVYTGDPTKKRCGSLAMFISETPRDIEHSMTTSLAVAGGSDVQSSLKALALKQRLIQATVHKSQSVGDLGCAEICYVVLPLYASGSKPAGFAKLIEAAIQELLESVAMTNPDILLTSLTAPPHKYPTELYAQSVLSVLANTNLGIYNDVQVTIFIENEEQKITFYTKMKELGFGIDFNHVSKNKRGANDGNFKVQVLHGDVTKTHCGALVNSTAIDMRYNCNAISSSIHTAAGPDLRKTCQSLVDQGVLLKDGIVVPTTAGGTLRCNMVIHAHVPGKLANRPATKDQIDKLKTVVLNCLKTADEEKQSSLAMPAFCLGIGNFDVPDSAKPTLEAIKEFTLTKPTHLKEVQIVLLDQKMFILFKDWFEEFFSKLNIPTTKIDSSSGCEGISTLLNTTVLPHSNRGRINTVTAQGATQKKYKLTFRLFGLQEDTLTDAETEIIKYINELIVDDMVDLGEMTSLLTETDVEDIYQLANREGVNVTIDRRLNRILINGEERAVERVCHQIQMNVVEITRLLQELHMFEWTAQSTDGTVEKYDLEASQKLEVAYKRKTGVVKLTIDSIECTVDLNTWEEKEGVAGTTKTVTRTRKTYAEYPPDWDLTVLGKEVVNFIDIPETSDEYNKATNRFLDTIGCQCDIGKVQRVQNPSEYTRYQSLKKSWIMLHGGVGSVTERELFHGTKKDNVMPICSTGFNRGYAADSNAARYGKGVYFALNASYSMQEKYSSADKEGYKYILVCSLLVCKVTQGNEKIKVPPPIPETPQVVYDTLVEKMQNPTIFVAMKDSQAYPKYVIMFKKRL